MRPLASAMVGGVATALLALVLASLAPHEPASESHVPPAPAARVLRRAAIDAEIEDRERPAFIAAAGAAAGPGPGSGDPSLRRRRLPQAAARAAGAQAPTGAGRESEVPWPTDLVWNAETLAREPIPLRGDFATSEGASGPSGAGTGPGGSPAPVAPPAGPTRRAAAVHAPHPPYPAAAQSRGEAGFVEVLVGIDASGRVTSVDVVASTGSPLLEDSVRSTVARWRFSPALRRGEPHATTIRRRFEFRIVDR